MRKRQRIRRSAAVWRELFARQARSDLSVAEFCGREKINAGVFRRWRAALKDVDRGAGRASVMAPVAEAVPFIELGGIGSGVTRFEVRLELGAGMVLSIARG